MCLEADLTNIMRHPYYNRLCFIHKVSIDASSVTISVSYWLNRIHVILPPYNSAYACRNRVIRWIFCLKKLKYIECKLEMPKYPVASLGKGKREQRAFSLRTVRLSSKHRQTKRCRLKNKRETKKTVLATNALGNDDLCCHAGYLSGLKLGTINEERLGQRSWRKEEKGFKELSSGKK